MDNYIAILVSLNFVFLIWTIITDNIVIAGVWIGISISTLLSLVLLLGNVTDNKTLYDQNISVDTPSYMKWMIDYKAELAKQNIK